MSNSWSSLCFLSSTEVFREDLELRTVPSSCLLYTPSKRHFGDYRKPVIQTPKPILPTFQGLQVTSCISGISGFSLFPSTCPQKGGGLRSLAQGSGAVVPGTLVQLFNLHMGTDPLNVSPLSCTIPNTVMHHRRTEVCTPDIKRQNILRQHELLRNFSG